MSGQHARPVPWRWATPATPGRPHYGLKMGLLATAMGRGHMPWQAHVSRVASEIDPATGEWAYQTVVISVQRQAGKTTLMIPANLQECMRNADSYCWYTAQTRQAARDNFLRDLKPLLRSKLAPLIKPRRANGSEGLEIRPNGSEYRVFTAGSDELHGKTNRRVNVDEAWAFDALQGIELMQGIVPTFTTTAGQLWIFSTAGTSESEFLREWVSKGRAAVEADRRHGIAHFECAIPADADPADLVRPSTHEAFLDMVLANHPADGFTLKRSALLAALDQMGPAEWCRAYGNLWTGSAELLIGPSEWAACADPRPTEQWPTPQPGQLALGFDVAPDDADAAILAAWHDEDGTVVLAVMDARPGSAWLPGRLADLEHRWQPLGIGFNDYGPASVAADEIRRRAGLVLDGLGGHAYATACAGLRSAIARTAIRVQPDPALDAAVVAAARRKLGEVWVWDRRGSAGSIAALVAATAAKWTLEHAPPRFTVG